MTNSQLAQRIEHLEREVAEVKRKLAAAAKRKSSDDFFGMFQDDPDFEKALKLGAKYRQSLRPKSKRSALKK
jgi:hypothetical protein